MRIYIAGPLNAKDACGYLSNVHKFMEMDIMLRDYGHATYNPCLDMLVGIHAGYFTYEDYFEPSQEWLKVSDALFLIDHSPGADREVELAKSLDIPVVTSIAELEGLTISGMEPENAIRT